jgi:hypothetical protein
MVNNRFCEYAVARRRLVTSLLRADGIGTPNPIPPLLPGLWPGFFLPEFSETYKYFVGQCPICGAVQKRKALFREF